MTERVLEQGRDEWDAATNPFGAPSLTPGPACPSVQGIVSVAFACTCVVAFLSARSRSSAAVIL